MNVTKLTEWFPAHVKPAHVGVYEVRFLRCESVSVEGFSYWDGRKWSETQPSAERGAMYQANFITGVQNKEWRGLAKEPATKDETFADLINAAEALVRRIHELNKQFGYLDDALEVQGIEQAIAEARGACP